MNKSPSAVTITAQKQLADFAAMSGLNFTVDVHQSHQILASKISLLPIRTLGIVDQSSNCVMSNGIYSRFKILNPLLRKTNISNLEVRLIAFDLFDSSSSNVWKGVTHTTLGCTENLHKR